VRQQTIEGVRWDQGMLPKCLLSLKGRTCNQTCQMPTKVLKVICQTGNRTDWRTKRRLYASPLGNI